MSRNRYTLRLLSIAEQDFLDILEYHAAESLTAAHTLTDQIEKQLQSLSRHPFLGEVPPNAKLVTMGYKVFVEGDYLVFYKVRRKTVLVYRIIHEARDILPLLDEL